MNSILECRERMIMKLRVGGCEVVDVAAGQG
jgi:hypothetical protein